ncbi:hypothetical protein BH23BAC1_BH23BAC1_06150 [soil metagenome]
MELALKPYMENKIKNSPRAEGSLYFIQKSVIDLYL